MNENPYQAPSAESHSVQPQAIGIRNGSREDLRSVAKYQKGILICILIYLLAIFGQFLLPPQLRIILGLAILVNIIVATVFVFLLAIKVYSTGIGILFGILTLIPCIGLLALLVINGKATSILKQNGIKVGLLGADLSQV